MKKTYIYFSCLLMVMVQACKLTDVTDLKPEHKLDESTVVTDIPSADKLLAGTYYSLRDEPLAFYLPAYAGLMGVNLTSTSAGLAPYINNDVMPNNSTLNSSLYAGPYAMIQTANFVIEKTTALKVTDPRKFGIVAEARFLRALAHFYTLRLFGQFWDINSKFGIEIKDKPNLPISARADVKTSYEFILADLDEAIKNCPDYATGTIKGYATKLAAKAIKSKVLLYKKDYTAAALLAREVMNGPATLSSNFVNMFQIDKYHSDEVILAAITFANNNNIYYENGKTYYYTLGGYILSDRYTTLLANDARKAIIVKTTRDPADPAKWHGNGKFSKGVDGSRNDTEYYFRLAEAYLIYAEAETRRGGGNLADALAAVNALRTKRGVGTVSAAGKAELLGLIRTEKELELGAESGEDWFDIVRYITNKDVQAQAIKASLKDENKLILPIPQVSVDASAGVILQNPGY
ncbi:RagB/SusD family nutrient uptake outer membrane protein [Pedobacter gandavensis]|uniref:RagB/SusD family nutrient uptake outer membrane protein n=1 Tax=Pedobacter gandavensis TaxID=2679963 RepID=UPI00292CBB53|nr:RagB/SusD family nutrient uptake outer membrane protein [Pedobacter gandavensis]